MKKHPYEKLAEAVRELKKILLAPRTRHPFDTHPLRPEEYALATLPLLPLMAVLVAVALKMLGFIK